MLSLTQNWAPYRLVNNDDAVGTGTLIKNSGSKNQKNSFRMVISVSSLILSFETFQVCFLFLRLDPYRLEANISK